jgi:hypothetical protein
MEGAVVVMAGNLITATDDVFGVIKTAWDAGALAAVGGVAPTPVPVLVYEPLELDCKPHPRDSALPWGRVSIKHTGGRDAAIGRSGGLKRFRRVGFALVECFVPYKTGADWTASRRLAMLAQAAYQGKGTVNGVTFSGVTLTENGKSGSFYLCTVLANFRWDETA